MDFEFSYRTNGFVTHQPVLYEILRRTNGPVIEFGCGEGSIILIHEFCKRNKRKVLSLDDNLKWLNKYKDHYESELNKFTYVPKNQDSDPENSSHWQKILKVDEVKNADWDVVFIDQSPWIARFLPFWL